MSPTELVATRSAGGARDRRHRRTREPSSPHDYSLEPLDETVAELQSGVVRSRQRRRTSAKNALLAYLSAELVLLTATGDAAHAIEIAAAALRWFEEHGESR